MLRGHVTVCVSTAAAETTSNRLIELETLKVGEKGVTYVVCANIIRQEQWHTDCTLVTLILPVCVNEFVWVFVSSNAMN